MFRAIVLAKFEEEFDRTGSVIMEPFKICVFCPISFILFLVAFNWKQKFRWCGWSRTTKYEAPSLAINYSIYPNCA
jgi:hypothetical protein